MNEMGTGIRKQASLQLICHHGDAGEDLSVNQIVSRIGKTNQQKQRVLNGLSVPLFRNYYLPFQLESLAFYIQIWGFSKSQGRSQLRTPHPRTFLISCGIALIYRHYSGLLGLEEACCVSRPRNAYQAFLMMSKALFFETYKRRIKLKENFQTKITVSWRRLTLSGVSFGTYVGIEKGHATKQKLSVPVTLE